MMTVSLGQFTTTLDFSTGYPIAASSGYSMDPACQTDTSLWMTVVDDATGRCYSVCIADPQASAFEVVCPGSRQPGVRKTAANNKSTIFEGIPDWVILVGGAAVIMLALN